MFKIRILSIVACLVSSSAFSLSYTLRSDNNSIHVVRGAEDYPYHMSATEPRKSNSNLRSRSARRGTQARIPAAKRLPSGPREGIVLNLAVLRLYYFHPGTDKVSSYPVGAGKNGWSTPLGNTTVVGKAKNPSWRPPPSLIREAQRKGKHLKKVVGPGPRNPLGRRAIYLGMPRILIHGTTAPGSVGRRSSHGCIRMLNKDVEELFEYVPIGTPVRIVYEPYK